jgi:hypothetical protein
MPSTANNWIMCLGIMAKEVIKIRLRFRTRKIGTLFRQKDESSLCVDDVLFSNAGIT